MEVAIVGTHRRIEIWLLVERGGIKQTDHGTTQLAPLLEGRRPNDPLRPVVEPVGKGDKGKGRIGIVRPGR